MNSPQGPRQGNTVRSFNGCWTCRLRRKKCDEKRSVCDNCATLLITCYYSEDKPEWMDGSARQEEMSERIKREVKENAHLRREERVVGDRVSNIEVNGELALLYQRLPGDLASPTYNLLKANSNIHRNRIEPRPETPTIFSQVGTMCKLASKEAREDIISKGSCNILLMFYLEHLLPFLFPFYCPSLLQGGKAWILELITSSPVVSKACLCQSQYFFSLARGTDNHDLVWETVLTQTIDAFAVLRQALQIITTSGITEHIHGAVRIMASIMQVQRFEIAVLGFNNCQAHLNAALALFKQLLDSTGPIDLAGSSSNFEALLCHLGPSSFILPAQTVQVPSAEQAAFRFSSALLILDDIIASTVLQEQPRLYEYHHSLLNNINGNEPSIDLEAVVGCQNWALLQIGEIAALDAWKQRCKRAENLDVMELVYRASSIKDSLESHLKALETDPGIIPKEGNSLLDVLAADYNQQSRIFSRSSLATRVWAHAALIYLFVVLSGRQPANVDVRYHVGQIIELLTNQISPPALLRTMVWPFCVSGCLAEPAQEAQLRGMVEVLQPPSVFGTVRKALEIMENVWRDRDAGDSATRDLAACFRSQGDLLLLV